MFYLQTKGKAERVGFEPTRRLQTVYAISSRAPSANSDTSPEVAARRVYQTERRFSDTTRGLRHPETRGPSGQSQAGRMQTTLAGRLYWGRGRCMAGAALPAQGRMRGHRQGVTLLLASRSRPSTRRRAPTPLQRAAAGRRSRTPFRCRRGRRRRRARKER